MTHQGARNPTESSCLLPAVTEFVWTGAFTCGKMVPEFLNGECCSFRVSCSWTVLAEMAVQPTQGHISSSVIVYLTW